MDARSFHSTGLATAVRKNLPGCSHGSDIRLPMKSKIEKKVGTPFTQSRYATNRGSNSQQMPEARLEAQVLLSQSPTELLNFQLEIPRLQAPFPGSDMPPFQRRILK